MGFIARFLFSPWEYTRDKYQDNVLCTRTDMLFVIAQLHAVDVTTSQTTDTVSV